MIINMILSRIMIIMIMIIMIMIMILIMVLIMKTMMTMILIMMMMMMITIAFRGHIFVCVLHSTICAKAEQGRKWCYKGQKLKNVTVILQNRRSTSVNKDFK